MTRNEVLLAHIDVNRHDGLEIGALCNPVVPPDCPRICFADHLDTAGLREKYRTDPHVDIDRIVPVRFVWSHGALIEHVGEQRFDYVVAAHVVEHVPDLLGWLKHIAEVLRPGGLLALAVPDMRYTFDCQRRTTAIADLLQAYFEKYTRPTIRQVLDHFLFKVDVPEQCPVASLWEDPSLAARAPRSHPGLLSELGEVGLRKHFDAIQSGQYIDTHCSVFTPDSFIGLLYDIACMDMSCFAVRSFHPTLPGSQEFQICLEKLPEDIAGSQDRTKRMQYITDRLPVLAPPVTEEGGS